MKRLLKNIVFVFAFALAFVVGTVVTVKAAELKNTNVSGVAASYEVAEDLYYIVRGDRAAGKITLRSKAKGAYNSGWQPGYYTYTARVAVVKCNSLNSDMTCSEWTMYDYSTDKAKTNDDLAKGLQLGFAANNFAPINGTTEVNGANLVSLKSVYGLQNTYFVIVQYTWEKNCWFCSTETYSPEIFRVLVADELEPISITHSGSSTINVTITSGIPLARVRYFYTMQELESGYDFDSSYLANSVNATEELSHAQSNPTMEGSHFVYTFSINCTDGAHYYIQAEDLAGKVADYDVTKGLGNLGETKPDDGGDDGSNGRGPGNIGKIVLISLLVVLVIALLLVIIQKIVDYRRKLY